MIIGPSKDIEYRLSDEGRNVIAFQGYVSGFFYDNLNYPLMEFVGEGFRSELNTSALIDDSFVEQRFVQNVSFRTGGAELTDKDIFVERYPFRVVGSKFFSGERYEVRKGNEVHGALQDFAVLLNIEARVSVSEEEVLAALGFNRLKG